ncbi:MAG TPA: PAS domain S-box protein [Leptolyngbyaceae cyanobacterium]
MTDRHPNYLSHSGNCLSQKSPHSSVGAITEADVLVTAALAERPTRQPNLAVENQALHTLAQQLMEEPQVMLKTLVQIAKDLCQADTAGISLLETSTEGTSVFRWVAIAGSLECLEQTITPGDFSPCSTTLRSGKPQLYAYPERYFTYLYHPQFPIAEGLLFPLCINNQQLGTLWILSHTEDRQFDQEDQRLMSSLAGFTAATLRSMYQRQTVEEASRREQESQTKQKQTETSLRQIEEFNRQILESSDDCIKVLDLSGRLLYMNPRGQKLTAVQDLSSILNKSWIEFWQSGDQQAALEALEIAKAGEVASFQGYCPTAAGEPKWWDVKVTAIRGTEGQIERLLCVSRDITQQKRIEEARYQDQERLVESEKRLSAIFAHAAVGLSEIGLDGRFLRVNDTLCKMLGRSHEEVLAAGIPDVTHPGDVSRSLETFRHLIQAGEPLSLSKRYLRPNGTTVWASSSLTRLDDEQGHPRAVLAVTIDLSDHKRAEDERKRAELNAELLAAVSQDLVGATSISETMQAIGKHMNRYFNSSVCAFIEIEEQANQAIINHDWHLEEVPSLVGTYPLSEFVSSQLLSAARDGKTIVVSNVAADPNIAEPAKFDALKIGAFINVPLTRNNVWKFAIGVCHQQPYPWRTDEVDLIRELSVRIWNRIERIRAEEALRQSESRLRLIIESAQDYAIFTLGLDSIITSWNSGAERVLGYTEAEALGRSGHMIFTPEDRAQNQADREMQTALREGRAEDERWHIRKDGSRFWASGTMMQLQDEAGNVQGFVKILQDKTTQWQANERFRLLYDTTSELLATDQPLALMHNLFSKLSAQLELHCYYNFMVEQKDNRPVLHLKNYEGISEEAAKAIEWLEFGEYLCGQVAQQQQQIVLNRTQIATHSDADFITSAGISAYAGQPLIVQGRLLGTLAFGSYTRTHFTAEEIDLLQSTCDHVAIALDRANLLNSIQQQAEELQQANQIKDEFLAVLSHELRSPLNPILGWAKLLRSGTLDAAKTDHALAIIERNAKLQSELIEDLLDVSRILRGKLSLNVSPVNLASTTKAAIETVRLAAEAKSIHVQVNLEANTSPVLGDATRLQQVVWNLLSNAVKFTPPGGRVTVRLSQVQNQAQITISDNGKGIPSEFLPHVFEYFRQADSATTRQFGGLGLGLAIVHHLVELHGGTVEADSAGEGLGATFTVKIPLMTTSPLNDSTENLSQLPLTLQGVQVLVVDDDTDTREFMVFLLEQAKASVISATSVSEALAILMQSQPDVLLSDIGMPEMDGYTLLQQVRALPPEQCGRIPAIALTAYAGDFNQQKALAAGFQRHLSKPVDPEQVIKVIAELVKDKRREAYKGLNMPQEIAKSKENDRN